MNLFKNKKGFSLLELLIVIAVLTVIVGTAFSVQSGFLSRTYQDTSAHDIAQTLKLAHMRAVTRFQDAKWGVYIDEDAGGNDDRYILFKGDSYATRDTSFDIETQLSDSLSLSTISLNGGGDEVIFEKLDGNTSNYGSFVLTNNLGESDTISINSKGLVALNEEAAGGGGADSTAPAAIADLALSGATTITLDLDWTAPGDDASTGTATSYDIRYSTSTINDGNWASATTVTGEPTPSVAGTAESMTVTGLTASTTYYFAIKTSDEVPNESAISNVPNETTSAVAGPEGDDLSIDATGVSLTAANKTVTGITIENTGGSNVTIASMTVSWTGAPNGTKIQSVTIDSGSKWTGNVSSGTLLNITDFILVSGAGTYNIDAMAFSKDMSGTTISITFTMSDASTATINGITP